MLIHNYVVIESSALIHGVRNRARAVIKKTLSGIAKAQRDYETWSGDLWLWEAPEYMLTTYIAKELWTIPGSKYLTLEPNVRRAFGGCRRNRQR